MVKRFCGQHYFVACWRIRNYLVKQEIPSANKLAALVHPVWIGCRVRDMANALTGISSRWFVPGCVMIQYAVGSSVLPGWVGFFLAAHWCPSLDYLCS